MKRKTINLLKELERIQKREEKLNFLKGKFKDEKCLIFTGGPSFNPNTLPKIMAKFPGYYVVSVKQTYDVLGDLVDFHFTNIYNYKSYKYNVKPFIVTVTPKNWHKSYFNFGTINFQLSENTERENALIENCQFEKYKLENEQIRPLGPGIMHEIVLYWLLHLGFKESVIFGWDLGVKNSDRIKRFYDQKNLYEDFSYCIYKHSPIIYNRIWVRFENKFREILFKLGNDIKLNNPGISKNEAEKIARTSFNFYKFFQKNGLEIKIASDFSLLDERIPRIKI